MHKLSYLMYSIANFFSWILAIFFIIIIVFGILGGVNVIPALHLGGVSWGAMSVAIVMLIITLVTIFMVRKAKAKGTSKAWDLLFLILGIFGGNIFYFLGGLFGLFA